MQQGTSHHVIVICFARPPQNAQPRLPRQYPGLEDAIYLPSTKAWKRYSMAIPCNSCTYTLPIHFYSYVYWAIPVSNFRNIRFLLGQNTTMAVTLAGPRGHRNLQWFLRPGPHAQGQRWNSSTVWLQIKHRKCSNYIVCKCHQHWNLWYIVILGML